MRQIMTAIITLVLTTSADAAEVWIRWQSQGITRMTTTGERLGTIRPSEPVGLIMTQVGDEVWTPTGDTTPTQYPFNFHTNTMLRFDTTGQEIGKHVFPFSVSQSTAVVAGEVWARRWEQNTFARFNFEGEHLGDHASPVALGDMVAKVGDEVWSYATILGETAGSRVERFSPEGEHLGGFDLPELSDNYAPIPVLGGMVWLRANSRTIARFGLEGNPVDEVTTTSITRPLTVVGDEIWGTTGLTPSDGEIIRLDANGDEIGRYAPSTVGRLTLVVPEPSAAVVFVLVLASARRRRR